MTGCSVFFFKECLVVAVAVSVCSCVTSSLSNDIFLNNINAISVKVYTMVVRLRIRNFLFPPFTVTLNICQGYSSVKDLKLRVLIFAGLLSGRNPAIVSL